MIFHFAFQVFLNIKGAFESNDMLHTLQGLCQANCWGHFDGVDLLSYDTLSILTTQLQQVKHFLVLPSQSQQNYNEVTLPFLT